MSVEQPLIDHFKNYIPLNEEESKLLDKRVTQRRIRKKQMILQEGFICKQYSFVVTGCLRMYGVDMKGGEHNIQFAADMLAGTIQHVDSDIGVFIGHANER